jgi:high-affinity nickel-transport protein
MTSELVSLSGLLLMFVLGLRHGLDPDHIACIDGLTWRALSQSHRHAGWIGTLFALGHGLLVTMIAVVVSQLALHVDPPALAVQIFEWVPTALLLIVGILNLRLLLRRSEAYAPVGWKMSLIPGRLRRQSSAWSVILVGVLFATVFDTATQAAAWGYVASSKGGGWAALLAGLSFTAGMMVTDTLDGRIVCRIGRGVDAAETTHGVRRTLGWLIVVISFGVAFYNVAKAWMPQVELDDLAFSMTGAALVLVMLAAWGSSVWLRKAQQPCALPGLSGRPRAPSDATGTCRQRLPHAGR